MTSLLFRERTAAFKSIRKFVMLKLNQNRYAIFCKVEERERKRKILASQSFGYHVSENYEARRTPSPPPHTRVFSVFKHLTIQKEKGISHFLSLESYRERKNKGKTKRRSSSGKRKFVLYENELPALFCTLSSFSIILFR